jgi:hypothetical protein
VVSPGGWFGDRAQKLLVGQEGQQIVPELKVVEGFAHRFRPTYAGANVAHPFAALEPVTGLRGGPVVSPAVGSGIGP